MVFASRIVLRPMSQWTDDGLPEQCNSPVADSDASGGEHTDIDSDSGDHDWPDTVWADEPRTDVRHVEIPERKLTTFYPSPPLGLKPQETRLLRLLPGEFDSPIRCSLSIQSLTDGLSYEALSYTWGRTTLDNVIVNGHPMQVTYNLLVALRYLRRPDQVRILWVDAICMNQRSIAERNHQVAFMNKIYRSAARVLIWLGQGTDVSKGERPSLYSAATDPATWAKQHHMNRTFRSATEYTTPSWWTRAWTVQEFVVAASSPIICFHTYAVSLGDMDTVAQLREHDISGFFSRIDELVHLAKMYNDRGADLLEAMRLTADCQALNMRDKVYSVLGLLESSQVGLLKPDYSMPIREVYALATKICLHTGHSFALFPVPRVHNARMEKDAIPCDDLSSAVVPSWAMNFADDAARLRRTPSELEEATSFAKLDLHDSHDDIRGRRRQDGPPTPPLVLHCYILQIGKVSEMVPAGGDSGRHGPLIGLLTSKMAELFSRNLRGKSAMTELHDDFARRHPPISREEWMQVGDMVREGFRQNAYPYHLVNIGRLLDWALDTVVFGETSLFGDFVRYVDGARILGTSGATFLGNAMRRRLLEHCFQAWQDEECIKWLQFRDMGAVKTEGNGALFCTDQSHFGIAEAVVEKGDLVAILVPDMKTILLKPRAGNYGTVRYEYKGFVYLPAVKHASVPDVALQKIELF
ncbi:hypothetical protein LTR86_006008 [Recurvomyces mirabilis]|nr:hypothetical protein LTR86_006008 [Recurvomyces mirabilis]